MKTLLRLPLHYQILIALVAGTILGVATNPGEIELPDVNGSVTSTAAGQYTLNETDAQGKSVFGETIRSKDEFANRYPKLAAAHFAAGKPVLKFSVRRRRVHVSERMHRVSLEYKREFVPGNERQLAVSGKQASSPSKLTDKPPADAVPADLRKHIGNALNVFNVKHEPGKSVRTYFLEAGRWDEVYGQYAGHAGGISRQVSIWSKWIGDLFLRLLKMITIPLIVTSLVTGVAGLGGTSQLGRMFGRTLLYYLVTSMLAITTGIVLVNLIQPGVGVELPGGGEGAIAGQDQTLAGVFTGLIDNMFPANPIEALSNAKFLSIITFSILFGLFIIFTGGESGRRMRGFFQAAFDVMMNFTLFIIKLAPIGVLAFMTFATASQGLEIFVTLAKYIVTVFLALVVHACITLPLIIRFVARRSPAAYVQAMSPALMTAFSTASSNGTLPLTMTCVEERAGVPNRVSSFVLPLGATINMDGTALYEAVAVLFIAQATPGFELTPGSQILVAITALMASIGAAGIPHAGLVMMAIVLQAVGLPLEAQGIIIAVDRVLDMCRTSVNVWSDSCGCAVIARYESAALNGEPEQASPAAGTAQTE